MTEAKLRKLIQAAALLLKCERTRQMSYFRLLKLLYIADRQSLKDRGYPILGIRAVAMKHGPLHSEALDLIKNQIESPDWHAHIRRDGYHVELVDDPGTGTLSPFEVEKLNAVSQQHADLNDWDLAELTHMFREWQDHAPGDSSEVIPIEDIIRAVGRGNQADDIIGDLCESEQMDRLLESPI